jgi:hypothetical protein
MQSVSERWWDDYEGYCPFTSEPIGKDVTTNLPIFEGDCTWICCGIDNQITDSEEYGHTQA